jgi:hypothetical protein
MVVLSDEDQKIPGNDEILQRPLEQRPLRKNATLFEKIELIDSSKLNLWRQNCSRTCKESKLLCCI